MTKARKLADLIDVNGDVAVANLDNVTADAITAGTLSSDRLPTVPVEKGGTGATTLGAAGQFLKVNATADGVEYGDVQTPDWNTLANKPTNISAFSNDAGYTTQGYTGASGSVSHFGNIHIYAQGVYAVNISKSGTTVVLGGSANCNCDCNG